MAVLRSLFTALAVLSVKVLAQNQCISYGIDYANGGSYYIDASSSQYFTFVTVFQGCNQESINPILIGPNNDQYACSTINTQPSGTQVTSTCGIPYSAMKTGVWKIIMSGQQVQVQRSMTFTVGTPETTTVTATPTIVLGITSTPRASTVQQTLQQTQTLILVPGTVTSQCNSQQVTVTNIARPPTITLTSTVLRTATDGARTSYYTSTSSTTAICHYPTKKRSLEDRAANAVAAVTVTYTQTTFTVTQTLVTTIPALTTTEIVFRTITATVAPSPSTVCAGGGRPGQVVTVNPPQTTVTQTNLVYQTTHISGTVWIGTTSYTTFTNAASATACWRAGGWYGL